MPTLVDISSSATTVASHPSARGVTVLDCSEGLVVGTKCDPTTPPHLVLARSDQGASMQFQPIVAPEPVADLSWSSLLISPPPSPPLNLPYTAHYIGPESGEKNSTPLIGEFGSSPDNFELSLLCSVAPRWTPLCDYNRVQDGGEVLRQPWFWGALRQL